MSLLKIRSNRSIALILASLVVSLSACESATNPPSSVPVSVSTKAVFVLNEGSFGHNNASLDVYLPTKDSVVRDVIPHLGDVGNDAELLNGKLYVVLNNSGKIYVIQPDTVKKIDSVEFANFEAPNVLVQISPTKALVTQLYNPNAVILDLQSDKITSSIHLGSGSVGAAVLDNHIFVSSGSDSLNVCDPIALSVTQVIKVGDIPQTVIADSTNNQIVVLCWGDYGVLSSSVYFVNASTLTVTDSVHFPGGAFIQSLFRGGSKLYAVAGDSVASIDLATRKIVNAAFATNMAGYYDGGYDAGANEVYLGRTGYSSNSSVDVYEGTSGILKRSFGAGIAPAHFAFYR